MEERTLVEPESADIPSSCALTLHHVGVWVKQMEEGIAAYCELGAKLSEPVFISSQGVRVCFADLGGGALIELVEAVESASTSALSKRGSTYYHVGYLTKDFDTAIEVLPRRGYVHMNTFYSEAFNGRRCAFLMSPIFHLIEIIEQG